MSKVVKTISDFLFITGLVIAGVFLLSHFTGKKPFQAYIVSSGSMEPAIQTGSVVVVAPKSEYQVTDIVTYFSSSSKKATTTHRIVATDGRVFKMAGDANDQPDPVLVSRDQIVGAVSLVVPYIGYIANFAKTPYGFILLVIIPATIIVYEELKSLLFEIKKVIQKLKNRKGHTGEGNQKDEVVHTERSAIFKPVIILPIFFALLIPLSLSISYFIDHETSANNSFTGALPTPTPTQIEPLSTLNFPLSIESSPTPEVTPTSEPTPEPTPTEIPTPTPEPTPQPAP